MMSFLQKISSIPLDALSPDEAVANAVAYKRELEASDNPHIRDLLGLGVGE